MRRSLLPLAFGLIAFFGILGGAAFAQFRVGPAPGGFGGAGALGPAGIGGSLGGSPLGGSGIGGLSGPGLGSDLGSSGLGTLPTLPNYPTLPESNYGASSSGSAAGGSPPPPDEERWNVPHVPAPPIDDDKSSVSHTASEVRDGAAESAGDTVKASSGWRFRWWHGLVAVVVLGLIGAAFQD